MAAYAAQRLPPQRQRQRSPARPPQRQNRAAHPHPQRRPITKERQACAACRTLVTDAPPAGWTLHLLCRQHSSGLARSWGQGSPRASHLSQLSPAPGPRQQASAEELDAAEEWARRGLVMGLSPQEFETLQILLRSAFDAVGRTVWRRAFTPSEPRLFTQSLPDLSVWGGPTVRAHPEPEPQLEPEQEEQATPHKTLSFASFAALVRGKMSLSACPDEMLVRMWLLLDALPPRGQLTWSELSHAVRQCPLYKAVPTQPRIPHSDAIPMPPWSVGHRVYVPGCGVGTIVDLSRMAGDVRVAIDADDYASQKKVWRRREDVARIVTDPNCAVQGVRTPAAEALRLILRQSQEALQPCPEPGERSRGKVRSGRRDMAAVAPGASMWATSPLNLQSPAATTQRASKQQQRKARRVRERVAKGASPAAAERQVREEEATAQKLYRASRLYGIIGDIDADEGCSPRTWWINERQRRAVAQEKAAASMLRKEADAAARAAAALTAEQAGGMQSPYATPLRSSVSTKNPAPRTQQSRLRGGGRVLLPPSRARSPPVAAPNISHLIPAGPLLWDPVRGFEEERLAYPLAVPVSPVRASCRHAHATPCTNSSSRLYISLV